MWKRAIGTVMLLVLVLSGSAFGDNWPRFRGPRGLGVAPDCDPPVNWSEGENIAWKTLLPGAGVSSPVVWGDKIFLTCYKGVDRWSKESRKERAGMEQSVLCLRTSDGEILWEKDVEASQKNTSSRVVRWHGYASHTPVTDGETVYAYFGTTGVVALDFEGNEQWTYTDVGEGTHGYGTAASPVLCGDKLIVPAQIESRSLIALNKENGEVIWRVTDQGGMWEGFRWGYSTPVVAEVDGKRQLILGIMNGVAAYDAEDGRQIWKYFYKEEGKGHSYPATSPFVVDGVVYFSIANSHGANDTMAIELGGEGYVKDTHLLWHTKHGAYVGGPVYHDGHLYFAHFGNNSYRPRQGFFCLDAKTGETVYWEKRKEMAQYPSLIYASALLAGDRVYIPSVSDGVWALAAKPEYELLAVNEFADDDTAFSASPVPLGADRMLLRSDKALYCIGKE